MKTPKDAYGLKFHRRVYRENLCKGFSPGFSTEARQLNAICELTPEQLKWAQKQFKKL